MKVRSTILEAIEGHKNDRAVTKALIISTNGQIDQLRRTVESLEADLAERDRLIVALGKALSIVAEAEND